MSGLIMFLLFSVISSILLFLPFLLKFMKQKMSGIEAGFSSSGVSNIFSIQFLNIFIIFIIFDLEIFLLFSIILDQFMFSSFCFLLFIGFTLFTEWKWGFLEWNI